MHSATLKELFSVTKIYFNFQHLSKSKAVS